MPADATPPLPEPLNAMHWQHAIYTADQLRAYAAAAVQAEREACAALVERCTAKSRTIKSWMDSGGPPEPCAIAAAIRARKDTHG